MIPRLVVFDLDGTLAPPDGGLTQETVEHSGEGECEHRFPERITFSYQLRLRPLAPEGAAFTQANRPQLF